jgi:hypothetical protein
MFVKANAILFTCKYDNFSRSHDVVVRVFDEAGDVIETHEHKSDFKEWYRSAVLLTVQNRLGRGFVQFELRTHFL